MNPLTSPDRILSSRHPTDIRAGIQRLASIVSTDFGEDPQDGALYCFVSRDCLKMKMLRFDVNGWVLYYCYLAEGTFRWEHRPDYADPKRPRRSPPTSSYSGKNAGQMRFLPPL